MGNVLRRVLVVLLLVLSGCQRPMKVPGETDITVSEVTGIAEEATVPTDRRPWARASWPTENVSEPGEAELDTDATIDAGSDTDAV